jgi:DnaJ family protein C protein 7
MLRCAKAHVRRGETDAARARLEAAKREEPTNKQVEEELAAAASVERAQKEAKEAVRDEKGRLAIEACTRGLALAPYCPQLRLSQAEAFLLLRQWAAAGQVAVGLLRDNARNPDALFVRGTALYQAGQLDEALALWAEALRCDPDHAKAARARKAARGIATLRQEAKDFAAAGRHPQAHASLTRALACDPANAPLTAALAMERAKSGRKAGFEEQALADVGLFLAQHPADEEAREMRLELLVRLGRHKEVVQELRKRAQDDPEDFRIRRRFAILFSVGLLSHFVPGWRRPRRR